MQDSVKQQKQKSWQITTVAQLQQVKLQACNMHILSPQTTATSSTMTRALCQMNKHKPLKASSQHVKQQTNSSVSNSKAVHGTPHPSSSQPAATATGQPVQTANSFQLTTHGTAPKVSLHLRVCKSSSSQRAMNQIHQTLTAQAQSSPAHGTAAPQWQPLVTTSAQQNSPPSQLMAKHTNSVHSQATS